MLVLVVLVVEVQMVLLQRCRDVLMGVLLGQVQPHADLHQGRRCEEGDARDLPAHRQVAGRAHVRGHREIGPRAGRPRDAGPA
jgi:hypothetical protein